MRALTFAADSRAGYALETMTGRLGSLPGWLALAASAALASTVAQATPIAEAAPQEDAAGSGAAQSVFVRFELVASAQGARTLVLDDSDRRTPLGEVPAAALCEAHAEKES